VSAAEVSNSRVVAPSRRWWRPQFRLRTILLSMLVCALILGRDRFLVQAWRERLIGSRLEASGLVVGYAPARHPPRWLCRAASWIGWGDREMDEHFRRVQSIQLNSDRCPGPFVLSGEIAELSELEYVDVNWDASEAVDYTAIASVPTLRYVDIRARNFDERNAKALAVCPSQCSLSLGLQGDKIDDSTMERIGRIRRVWHLILVSDRITDKGMASLVSLPELGRLYIEKAKITDASLAYLRDLTGLRVIYLANVHCSAEGDGISVLGSLPHLEELGICASDRSFTFAHLTQLEKAPALTNLGVRGTCFETDVRDCLRKFASLERASFETSGSYNRRFGRPKPGQPDRRREVVAGRNIDWDEWLRSQ
jgi:hypothetical protein